MESDPRYLSARQAAGALGVTLATLYAYTSRGQLRSEPVPGSPRECRYYRDDVERLRERKETRRDPAQAAARGLRWGSPVLSSGITLVDNGRLYYRGRDVLKLAREATLEEAAELLWEVDAAEGKVLFEQPCRLSHRQVSRLGSAADHPLVRFQLALPLAGALDAGAYDLRPAAVRRAGGHVVRLLTTIVAGPYRQIPIHRALEAAWAPTAPGVGEAIRTALVLCADHELNVSAFTARCAASAGASPYDVVSAAIATLKGRRHGGETERVAALVAEAVTARRAATVVANRLRRGERLPGFGHPLYPAGDPRAALLMELAEGGGNRASRRLIGSVAAAGCESLRELPNLDFGLVAMAQTHGLPEYAPIVLFALGRTIGWIAHALEQYATGELIRPRAAYIGPAPGGR